MSSSSHLRRLSLRCRVLRSSPCFSFLWSSASASTHRRATDCHRPQLNAYECFSIAIRHRLPLMAVDDDVVMAARCLGAVPQFAMVETVLTSLNDAGVMPGDARG